ncbi:phosphoinositide 3-kinase regulatory subunit 4 [Octopus bimaculoides]|nr:phosphoinositide 3-kinase regulatory subunit 4 [Octopus bimaculoides]
MGNQLTGIAPSQILPVEQYLADIPDYEFEISLGSTRFFKVARARCKEGQVVVKVFVIHDPSLPLATHRNRLEEIKGQLSGASNCLPFQKFIQSDKAALLFRQYTKDSLYDRISTRPFLNAIEKKWIAFQLLCALNQCHKLKVCHGDIKSENVMITSWNWLFLTDFASFKPTYLPEDNPSDFSYFFDTSRRRTCYIAPERFVDSSWKNADAATQVSLDLTSSETKFGDLTPAMDIFSSGCVIAELFTEGTVPFDLSQLLAYRNGEYSPWKVLEKIEDSSIRELVRHMMQKEPTHRLSAEEYLIQQRGKAFPNYFYTYLKLYIQRFAVAPILSPDERIVKIKKELPMIFGHLNVLKSTPEENTGLVLIISLVGSSLRSLQFASSKSTALELLLEISQHVTAEIILDRLLPLMLCLAEDPFPRVRADTLRTIVKCLSNLKSVPKSDANIFPEYIFPYLSPLTQDTVTLVRAAYAENIAQLAEIALRVLDMIHLNVSDDSDPDGTRYQVSYDAELQTLQEIIQQKVVMLLCDQDNIVKQTLLENGFTRLCVFFGRQKASDILLSHMITFLNDKLDWQLRASFFENVVGVAAYVGWQSSCVLKPLIQQGLSDSEEFVIYRSLGALSSLVELGLIQKIMLYDFIQEVVPFLAHPGIWVRQGAIGFITAVAHVLNVADVHCNLIPRVRMFLKQSVLHIDQKHILLNCVGESVPRAVFDYIVRSPNVDGIYEVLLKGSENRKTMRRGHKSPYPDLDDNMSPIFRKLFSLGMSELTEEKLIAMKDFILKLNRSRSSSVEAVFAEIDDDCSRGKLNLRHLGNTFTRRHADLFKPKDTRTETPNSPARSRRKKSPQLDNSAVAMNAEWKSMFGSSDTEKSLSSSPKSKANIKWDSGSERRASLTNPALASNFFSQTSTEGNSLRGSIPEKPFIQTRYAPCKQDLRNLVNRRREQYEADIRTKDILEGVGLDQIFPPQNWKPKGQLVAHMQEHKSVVNRIAVCTDHSMFATCSNDGTMKLWDCGQLEGKSVANRSKFTYSKQGGHIQHMAFCKGTDMLASASDNGSIQVFKLESGKVSAAITHNVDVSKYGHVVDMNFFDSGSKSVLAYATVNGNIIGWDTRMPDIAWNLKNEYKTGLITSFAIHQSQCWLATGTSNGAHICWDMRFHLPIATIKHPADVWIRRVMMHPQQQSWVLSAVQGNNEVSMWEVETGARQKALWASNSPALSHRDSSDESVYGMYIAATDNSVFMITGGSDMRVRFWDLNSPNNSFIMVGAATDVPQQMTTNYVSRLVDGTEVIIESCVTKPGPTDDMPGRYPKTPSPGHKDIINDVNMCYTSQYLVVTASYDGVVKVWK